MRGTGQVGHRGAAPLGRAEGRELRAGFALSPTLPSARRSTSCKQGIPGHQSDFAFQTQVECQTSVVPGQSGSFPSLAAIFRSSLSSHPVSPATSYCLFSQRPSHLLRCSNFFFPPSLHVYSLILSARFSQSWLCTVSKYRKYLLFYLLFFLYPSANNSELNLFVVPAFLYLT